MVAYAQFCTLDCQSLQTQTGLEFAASKFNMTVEELLKMFQEIGGISTRGKNKGFPKAIYRMECTKCTRGGWVRDSMGGGVFPYVGACFAYRIVECEYKGVYIPVKTIICDDDYVPTGRISDLCEQYMWNRNRNHSVV